MKFSTLSKINNKSMTPIFSEEGPAEPAAAPEPAKQEQTEHKESQGAGSSTAVAEPPAPAPVKPRVDKLPPWKVLLHNDDENTMEHVVITIVMLTPLTLQDAVDKTMEAHNTGVSLIMTTHKEKAELVQEQFASRKLIVTIEPDGK